MPSRRTNHNYTQSNIHPTWTFSPTKCFKSQMSGDLLWNSWQCQFKTQICMITKWITWVTGQRNPKAVWRIRHDPSYWCRSQRWMWFAEIWRKFPAILQLPFTKACTFQSTHWHHQWLCHTSIFFRNNRGTKRSLFEPPQPCDAMLDTRCWWRVDL